MNSQKAERHDAKFDLTVSIISLGVLSIFDVNYLK
jgi:hypothetical protein